MLGIIARRAVKPDVRPEFLRIMYVSTWFPIFSYIFLGFLPGHWIAPGQILEKIRWNIATKIWEIMYPPPLWSPGPWGSKGGGYMISKFLIAIFHLIFSKICPVVIQWPVALVLILVLVRVRPQIQLQHVKVRPGDAFWGHMINGKQLVRAGRRKFKTIQPQRFWQNLTEKTLVVERFWFVSTRTPQKTQKKLKTTLCFLICCYVLQCVAIFSHIFPVLTWFSVACLGRARRRWVLHRSAQATVVLFLFILYILFFLFFIFLCFDFALFFM